MKRLIIIPLIVSCGSVLSPYDGLGPSSKDPPDFRKGKGVDSELQPYVSMFEEIIAVAVPQDLPITFGNIDGLTLGVCLVLQVEAKNTVSGESKSEEQREIIIDTGHWEFLSEQEKMTTIFHELGHCVLNLDHDESTFTVTGAIRGTKSEWEEGGSFIPDPYDYVVARASESEMTAGWFIHTREIPYSIMYPSILVPQGDPSDLMPHYYAVLRGEDSPLDLDGEVWRPIENMIPEQAESYAKAEELAKDLGYTLAIPFTTGFNYSILDPNEDLNEEESLELTVRRISCGVK